MAKQVDNNYHKLRQLLLVEEFKKCLQSDVKVYLDEQKADGLHQAAILADDYSLTHKTAFPTKSEQSVLGSGRKSTKTGRFSPPITRSRNHGQGRGRFDSFCEFAGGPVCYYCKKHGHVMAECRALDKKNATRKTNALVIPQDQTTPAVQSERPIQPLHFQRLCIFIRTG